MALEGVLIDTGGLDKFLDPDTAKLKRFWEGFGTAHHFITPVVYWEFLNAFDQYSQMRRRLKTMIDKGNPQGTFGGCIPR